MNVISFEKLEYLNRCGNGLWLDGRGLISGRFKQFSLFHSVQTVFGALPDSHPKGTGEVYSGGHEAGM
jgi:hypothetical protein